MPNPRRIASLLASGTEILYLLELGEQVVAVSHECDWPPAARDKPRVTFSHVNAAAASGAIDQQVRQSLAEGEPLYGVDVEQLAALAPELIVTQAQCDVCAVRYDDVVQMARSEPALAETEIVALNPTTLEEIFQDILRVGAACGRQELASKKVDVLRGRVETIRRRTAEFGPQERRRTLCIEWIEPLMSAANWMPDLIALAGGVQPFATAGAHSGYTPWSDVAAFDPEVIVVMPCGFDLERSLVEAESLPSLAGWSDLSAVRAGRVHVADGNAYFNRSGPRLVDSLEILAHLVHPERFAAPKPVEGRPAWRRLG